MLEILYSHQYQVFVSQYLLRKLKRLLNSFFLQKEINILSTHYAFDCHVEEIFEYYLDFFVVEDRVMLNFQEF
jgi:hypothetical protein